MSRHFTETELEAYLDESLAAEEMAQIETALRSQDPLAKRLATIIGRRDAGIHSLGDIWRRHRSSCPTREQLGSLLLGVLSEEHADYIGFHIDQIGCRLCRANLEDLKSRKAEASDAVATRRQRFFQSSAGYLQAKK